MAFGTYVALLAAGVAIACYVNPDLLKRGETPLDSVKPALVSEPVEIAAPQEPVEIEPPEPVEIAPPEPLEISAPELQWWQTSIVYQIYPRSFQDSNGDGVGDLKGIESRLDYVKSIGADAIWLSPIYTSPFADFGYDIADFNNIDPIFGTLSDFDDLVEAVHDREMKLIMDYIPNHSSDLHEWFKESRKSKDPSNPYRDFYIWHPGKTVTEGNHTKTLPPNNWLSVFSGSAWEWDETRKEYYFHQFVKEQPDLNFRNPKVVEEMLDVLRFWVERGVDGFRVDAIAHMFESEDVMQDEPRSNLPGVPPGQFEYNDHIYTFNFPEIHDVTQGWRTMFDEYEEATGKHIYMVMEMYGKVEEVLKYYHSGSDHPFNFALIAMNRTCDGHCLRRLVGSFLDNMPADEWPSWVIGNHDNKRISTRMSPKFTNLMNILLLLLPGTPTTYYGEELALRDIKVTYDQTMDPWGRNFGPERYMEFTRDPARSPMQWNASKNAGFSTSKPWLPVHPNYKRNNVEEQVKDATGKQPLSIYKLLSVLRREPAFQYGDFRYARVTDTIFSFVRETAGFPSYLVVLNVGTKPTSDDFTSGYSNKLPSGGTIVCNSGNFMDALYDVGTEIDLKDVKLSPGQAVVIEF